ncbi:MAG TPA: fumarylacetoacetate hydrolase family protein [Cyclobacteriaceae bacterium]|nr:fumarylacetoacetate hydrolase family protein [Cyclobacteriaceae bacterium]
MKLYKIKTGILAESSGKYYLVKKTGWDEFFNDNHLAAKIRKLEKTARPVKNGPALIKSSIMAPISNQEIWASGVTYENSKLGRQEESKNSGGGQFYAHVYTAERPELFFKATAQRTVASGARVRIRKDSTWDVPEPELTLAITSSGKIIGYTIGNDMSSRSIEGENPLYLPQAKTYEGCAALGPCIYVTEQPLNRDTMITLQITRAKKVIFKEEISISRIRRKFEDLVAYLFRECAFPFGCFLMTGTGIVPPREFTLKKGDEIKISIDPIGTLINTVG